MNSDTSANHSVPPAVPPVTLKRLLETKNLTMFAGICFIFNAVSGPAIPYTAANFQTSGWIFTVLTYVLFTFLAGLCNLFLIESIQAIPGNKFFQGDVEFATIINFFFGPRLHTLGQFMLYGALQANSMQCLVLTAQATDQFLVSIVGSTCGLSSELKWICTSSQTLQSPSPFEDTFMLFTCGLLIAMFFSIPFFFYDLDKSVILTVGCSIISLGVALIWVGSSVNNGLEPSRMPAVTSFGLPYAQTMGTVSLNLACATVVPSWINIKSNLVNTQKVMWVTLLASSAFYLIIGIFFSLGFEFNSSNNSLQALIHNNLLGEISVALYSYTMLLPSVPVNCIVSRSNLIQNNICSEKVAVLLSFILPVFACIPLQTNNYLFLFLTWTSLIFTSTVNFILPLGLYLKCVEFRHNFKQKVLSLHQLKLLSIIHSKSVEIEEYLQMQQNSSPIALERFSSSHGEGNFANHKPRIVLMGHPHTEHHLNAGGDAPTGSSGSASTIPTEQRPPVRIPTLRDRQDTIDEYAMISIRVNPPSPYPTSITNHQFFHDPEDIEQHHLEAPSSEGLTQRPHSTSSGEGNKLSLKVDKRSRDAYPKLSPTTFIDPDILGIPDTWHEDLPDPDLEVEPSHSHGWDDMPTVSIEAPVGEEEENEYEANMPVEIPESTIENLLVPIPAVRRNSDRSFNSAISSGNESLPRERQFKCPPFRAIPRWVPFSPYSICVTLLIFMSTLSIVNIVFNGVYASN